MTIAICALLGVITALCILHDRTVSRMHEERRSWQLERANLLQRIQAPEQAVPEHTAKNIKREGPLYSNEFSEDQHALEELLGPVEEH